MALYESFDHQDPMPATTAEAEQSQDKFLQIPGINGLAEAVGLVMVGLLLLAWAVGAYAGIVYWSVQGSLGGVILSVLVPGFGAASTVPLYIRLGSGG